jgi:glycosyltransferase involved in cell wall biosynthesis
MIFKIHLDTRWCGEHGIGRFSAELVKRLPHTLLDVRGRPMSPLDPFRLSWMNFPDGALFLSPGYNAPLYSKTPYIFTIHDLNHIDRPENSSFFKNLYYRLVLSRLCHRASAILTVSEFSKKRIIDFFGVNPERVVNVGNGVDESFTFEGEVYSINTDYILCVSNRRGHKNEFRLLAAFANADLPKNLKLLFTGEATQLIISNALSLGISDRIVFTGKVSENDLASLYRGAVFMVFPSLYEGFGLPIVEAFASGTPVITSNVTAMPETAGEAALLVNPLDVKSISSAMSRLYASPELRMELRARGKARARYFSWDQVAERTINTINKADLYIDRNEHNKSK